MAKQGSTAAIVGAFLFDAGLRSIGRGGKRRLGYRVSGARYRARHVVGRAGFVCVGLVGGAAVVVAMAKERREAQAKVDASLAAERTAPA
jgi:hypothetical protein